MLSAGRGYFHGIVKGPRIDFWYRTCHGVDSNAGLVTTTLNGEVLEVDRSVGDLKDNRPSSLEERIVIGKWNRTSKGVDEQFPWSVTNLQLFHWRAGTNLSALSGADCAKPGDYLAWSAMEWAPSGDHLEEYQLAEQEVCRPRREERYDLAISLEQTQPRSLATCHKLGHAWMTASHGNSRTEFEEYIAWFDNLTGKRCKRLWTPFSDEEVK